MKLTKYTHACFTLEQNNKRLVVDPGSLNTDFSAIDNVAALVVTHVHFDHFDAKNIERISAANPELQIFTTQQVAEKLGNLKVNVVTDRHTVTVGPFKLQFFGTLHAKIHESMPQDQNVAVLINDTLYYPGDSFVEPKVTVKVLALPVSAPWLKMGDVIDFFNVIEPTQACFPIHDALLSDIGLNLVNNWIANACKDRGIEFLDLRPDDSAEI